MRSFKSIQTFTNPLLLLMLSTALLLVGIIFVPSVTAQEGDNGQLTVVVAALNVRSGPGITHPAFTFLRQGDRVSVIGYDADADWWQVRLFDGRLGWVSGGPEYVSINSRLKPADTPPNEGANHSSSSETIVFQTDSGGPIYAISPTGADLRYLTTGLDPALSPDGQWVAFTRWETSQDGALGSLWVINVNGAGERVLMNNVFNPRTPAWSPDGAKIVISMQHGGRPQAEITCGTDRPPRNAIIISTHNDDGAIKFCYIQPPDPYWGLRLVDVATGQFEDLPRDVYSFSPAWDPANSWRLVFDGNEGLVNLDLNQKTRWALTDDLNDRSPAFSPDGSKIAVSYWQHDHWEIHVMNSDSSGRVRLTQTPWTAMAEQILSGQPTRSWNNAAPAWSPDGSQLAFLTDRAGRWEIWVMNADGSNQQPLIAPDRLVGITLQYNGVNEQMLSWR
jgi:uncharacterized protein YraI